MSIIPTRFSHHWFQRLHSSGGSKIMILHELVSLPPKNAQNLALKPLNGDTLGYKRMSDTSIVTSKYLHTSHRLYIISLYHSGSALVLILHEQVHLLAPNNKNLVVKPLNGGTLGWKRMSDTSIMTSKCLHTFHGSYIRCLYYSGSSLAPILHERVCLPPQNPKN